MNLVELQRALQLRRKGRLLVGLLVLASMPVAAVADPPIASSGFAGAEDPLSENGAWAALTSLSPGGGRFRCAAGLRLGAAQDVVALGRQQAERL